MTYAILNNERNLVENIAESVMPLHVNWIQVPTGMSVSIGDHYDGDMFYSPSGELRMSSINQNMQDQVN